MTKLTIHYAFLPHLDADAALTFYRDILGFTVSNDVGYEGMRWITVAPADSATSIVLYPPGADPGVSEQEQQTILELMAKGTYASLTLGSDDLDGLFDRLVAAKVDVVQEPTDQPYGVRDAAVRDPSGNLLRINALD